MSNPETLFHIYISFGFSCLILNTYLISDCGLRLIPPCRNFSNWSVNNAKRKSNAEQPMFYFSKSSCTLW